MNRYYKTVPIITESGLEYVTIRNYDISDTEGLKQIERETFEPPFDTDLWIWDDKQIEFQVNINPEGCIAAEINGELVGSVTTMRTEFTKLNKNHSWEEMTGDGYITTHDSKGNTIYVVDITVKPKYQHLKIGSMLTHAVYELAISTKAKYVAGGGRLAGYHKHPELTPTEYINHVLTGQLKDPTLTFLIHHGRKPLKILENYIEDYQSLNTAVLTVWENPFGG